MAVSVASMFLVLIFSLQHGECQSIILDNTVKTFSEEAIAGRQRVYTGEFNKNNSEITRALDNNAKSVESLANAGSRLIFGRGSIVNESILNEATKSMVNVATSNQDKAIAGSQVVLDNVLNSHVQQHALTYRNEASNVGADQNGSVTAVSGSQFLVGNVDYSNIKLQEVAQQNTASNNFNGKAVAGVDQAFGNVAESFIVQDNIAEDNFAVAGDDRAVAGIQTGTRNVIDSTLLVRSESLENQAKATNGNAVAGVENSFGTMRGTFPGGSTKAVIAATSSNNLATSQDGKAIAGVALNAVELNRSRLTQEAEATNNKAVTFGEGDQAKDSVAGVDVVIKDAVQSTVVLNMTTYGNQAFNYHKDPNNDSDAIAGTQVTIGMADRSVIAVLANSSNNQAMAKYGDAIAGNKLNVLDSSADTVISWDLEAADNVAKADNGHAIVTNEVTIGGQATTIGN
eukprot:TRINITY_DN410_c0_g1_i2.p1 TRINITY_DN410_c0_g1~~TRINITY_DN410_c0_g1_i2.p1  ORF type:complete len:484 (-),score=79.91 TRINITY_DN410_c0_g1_i2:86-1456(-)